MVVACVGLATRLPYLLFPFPTSFDGWIDGWTEDGQMAYLAMVAAEME